MAPRTSWKGYLKLSLVSVPVKAFTANNTSEDVRLNQLHVECHSRIKYQKVCPEHGEVKADQITSGYEYAKGQYVVIDPQEVAKLRSQSDQTVKIHGFVPAVEVDPVYYAGKNYYLAPDGAGGAKAYALLHKGMVDREVYAIGQVVLSGREQLVVLRPAQNMLVMTVVNYAKKVKPIEDFADLVDAEEITPEEMSLTETLISASILKDFDYASYKDSYNEQLTKVIQMKVDGQEIVQVPDHEEPKILNLMEALKKSVAAAQTAAPPSKKTAVKKMAPSATGKRSAAKKKKSG